VTILEEVLLVMVLGLLFFVANLFIWISSGIEPLLVKIPLVHLFRIEVLQNTNSLFFSYIPGFIMFFLVNRLIPDKSVTSNVALIAALVTTVLWWGAGKLFSMYASAFHSYSMLYGAYAFLFVFVFWVYFSSIAFIVGVIVGQLHREKVTKS
jgi:membrane protein